MIRKFKNSQISNMHYKSPKMNILKERNLIIQTEKDVDGHSFVEYFTGSFENLIPFEEKIPKKVIKKNEQYFCPTCTKIIPQFKGDIIKTIQENNYCRCCGEKLDWSESAGIKEWKNLWKK